MAPSVGKPRIFRHLRPLATNPGEKVGPEPRAGESPLVSVVTPLYNHAPYLDDYVNGLLEQTYRRVELIVVDDASTDDSWSILQRSRDRLESRLERLVVSRNQSNAGLFATLERGLAEARGELVSILESDDYYYPTRIERAVGALLDDPEVGLVHSDVDFFHQAEGRLEPAHWRRLGKRIPRGRVFEELLHENHILTCTATMRASTLASCLDLVRYRRAGYETFDFPLFLDIARHSRIEYIDEPLACYRVVRGSISHPAGEIDWLEWRLRYYRVKMDYVERYGAGEAVRRRAEQQYYVTLYRSGWLRGDAERLERGIEGLRRTGTGGRSARWTRWARRHLVRSPRSWSLARRLERLGRARVAGPQGDKGEPTR